MALNGRVGFRGSAHGEQNGLSLSDDAASGGDLNYGLATRANRHDSCSMSRLHLGISEPHRKTLLIRDDLLERLAEIELEVRPFGPAEMGRAEDVRHGQKWMIRVGDRLVFVNVDGGIAGSTLVQRAQ